MTKREKDYEVDLGLSPNPVAIPATWPSLDFSFFVCDLKLKIPDLLPSQGCWVIKVRSQKLAQITAPRPSPPHPITLTPPSSSTNSCGPPPHTGVGLPWASWPLRSSMIPTFFCLSHCCRHQRQGALRPRPADGLSRAHSPTRAVLAVMAPVLFTVRDSDVDQRQSLCCCQNFWSQRCSLLHWALLVSASFCWLSRKGI